MANDDLSEYLKQKSLNSSFSAELSERGGYITFSNSGKRGETKFFTLGIDSLKNCLVDFLNNSNDFTGHENYDEKPWRDLGNAYYSDKAANAMSTVQTKPLFSTLSKIIAWANLPELEGLDFDQKISLNNEHIANAIIKLDRLSELYRPKRKEGSEYPTAGLENDFLEILQIHLKETGLLITDSLFTRFTSSLLTKPFVILTGLSGSGKTKLAQVFAKWICEDESQYRLIPVGADWTNREPLLGYPNALEPGKYVLPETGALELILEAGKPENQEKPYFLILDEMNLSHVERYFADFLSAMESGEDIPLHSDSVEWKDKVPAKIKLPKNLFIVGTVNIDETTYMFSPKVLDRANVIEFRVTPVEMRSFLEAPKKIDLDSISGLGAAMAGSFVEMAGNKDVMPSEVSSLNSVLIEFFNELKKVGAEFGYRSASEIYRFVAIANKLDPEWVMDEILDCAIMQKLLPKVHGSRRKLEPVLKTLGTLCLAEGKVIEDIFNRKDEIDFNDTQVSRFPISLEKIDRMYRGLLDNGFTSYAEA